MTRIEDENTRSLSIPPSISPDNFLLMNDPSYVAKCLTSGIRTLASPQQYRDFFIGIRRQFNLPITKDNAADLSAKLYKLYYPSQTHESLFGFLSDHDNYQQHILFMLNKDTNGTTADIAIGETTDPSSPAFGSLSPTFHIDHAQDPVQLITAVLKSQPALTYLLWNMSGASQEIQSESTEEDLARSFVQFIYPPGFQKIPPTQKISTPLFKKFTPPYQSPADFFYGETQEL